MTENMFRLLKLEKIRFFKELEIIFFFFVAFPFAEKF